MGSDYGSYVRSDKYGRGEWVRHSRVFLKAKLSSTVQFACYSVMQYASNHQADLPRYGIHTTETFRTAATLIPKHAN